MKFTDLDLKPGILKALSHIGYEDLTPIQEETFAHITAGRDIIALAETGSGKTSACSIPIIQSVDTDKNAIQALVMVPTRELALQFVSAISDVAQFTDVVPFAVYGGFSMEIQKAKLEHGVHVLVATPGRLIDLLQNTQLSLSEVRTFILDEADEMLNMGFISDVEFIISCLIHEHQTLLFSATMPGAVKKLAEKYLKSPLTLQLNAEQISPQSLRHHFQEVRGHKRFESLVKYIKGEKPAQAILFCNSRRNCESLFFRLKKEIKSVEVIHGGLEQSRRTSIFNRFKKKQIDVIVATGIASRGLDFSHVTHVINYDFPDGPQAYTHRSGRTARMGRKGTAVTFYTRHDIGTLKEIVERNNIEPVWLSEAPNLDKVRQRKSGGRRFDSRGKRKSFRPSRKRNRPSRK